MGHTRRDFFRLTAALATLASLPRSFASGPAPEVIFSGYRTDADNLLKDAGLHIGGRNLDHRIRLDNEIHSVVHSASRGLKIFLPKLDRVGYYQRGSGPLVKFFPKDGNYFYGHGVIDEVRGLLYTTQAKATENKDDRVRLNHDGYIFAYDLASFELQGSFPTGGKDPHDFLLSKDALYVCNGGNDSSVTVIDLKTNKIRETYGFEDKDLSLRHITEIDGDNFAIATLRYVDESPCDLYLLNVESGLKKCFTPPEVGSHFMKGQLLSVLAHAGHIYATCPMMNSLLVWKTSGQFVAGQVIPRAANLCFSRRLQSVIVGSGEFGEPARLATVIDNKLNIKKLPWAVSITGSHSLIL